MSESITSIDLLDVIKHQHGKLIKQLAVNSTNVVETALAQAHKRFLNRFAWSPAHQHIEIHERAASIPGNQLDELSQFSAEEHGKLHADSKVEVLKGINAVKPAIEHITQVKCDQISVGITVSSANRLAFTQRVLIDYE